MKKLSSLFFILIILNFTACSEQNGKVSIDNEIQLDIQSPTKTQNISSNPVQTATEKFWGIFKTGETQLLSELIEDKTKLQVILKHSISEESSTFTFNGKNEIEKWIDALHTLDKNRFIWGQAAFIENSPDRIISNCDKTSCSFEGGISHNGLFLEKITFINNSKDEYILSKIEIINGD